MVEHPLVGEIEALYRARLARFERVARAVTGDRESALDAVQDGFADAIRSCERFAGTGPLEGWVWRCVVNRARKARSSSGRQLALWVVAGGDDAVASDELAVRSRLALLPERQRLMVFLRYYADLRYLEIATALDVEVGTVSATLSAAHAALRAAYEEVPR